MAKKGGDRAENILMRILVFFISGIVLWIWWYATLIVLLINFFVVLFSRKRSTDLGKFAAYFGSEMSRYVKYLSFETEEKPFPFSELKKAY